MNSSSGALRWSLAPTSISGAIDYSRLLLAQSPWSAGSMSGGLLEFAHSGNGAMVKRLHLGRAAESGVLAASLAAEPGLTEGPACSNISATTRRSHAGEY